MPQAYLYVPEFVRHLRLMQAHPDTAPTRNVYYGVFFYTSYETESYIHHGSTYDLLTANKASGACRLAGQCEGAFPFTTGSMQLISRPLARALGSSSRAAAHIERSRAQVMAKPPRTTPAYEDVWMGFAIFALLESVSNVSIVQLDRFNYAFDTHHWPVMKNTTILVHQPSLKDVTRIMAAHQFALRQHCSSNGVLGCLPFAVPRCPRSSDANRTKLCLRNVRRYQRKYAATCGIRPDFERCPKSQLYQILPPRPKREGANATTRSRNASAAR